MKHVLRIVLLALLQLYYYYYYYYYISRVPVRYKSHISPVRMVAAACMAHGCSAPLPIRRTLHCTALHGACSHNSSPLTKTCCPSA